MRASGSARKYRTPFDRGLTRRKPARTDERLLRALERLLIATAAPESDRDLAEEEAAWNEARQLVDRTRARFGKMGRPAAPTK